MRNNKIIGLTGPIAAGKNEVAKILANHGAYIIDADDIGHELLSSKSKTGIKIKIKETFGTTNRKKLGEIVFNDKRKLEELNGIIHPALINAIKERVQVARDQRSEKIIINAALPQLFKGIVDEVWVVMAPKEMRLNRLIKSGLTKTDAMKRINSQMPQKEYLKIADKVIHNDGTLKQLKNLIHKFLQVSG